MNLTTVTIQEEYNNNYNYLLNINYYIIVWRMEPYLAQLKKYIHMQAPFSPLSVVGLSPLACMAWQQLPLPLLNSNLDCGPKCVALSYRLPMQ